MCVFLANFFRFQNSQKEMNITKLPEVRARHDVEVIMYVSSVESLSGQRTPL